MSSAHRPRKRFGQNFLIDHGVVEAIAAAVSPVPGDVVIEIGPGLGVLTTALLAHLSAADRPLHAVEIDRDLIVRLRKRFDEAELHLHAGDALAFDFKTWSDAQRQLGKRIRVVGNLPYNISSPLLFHLADSAAWVADQTFMLQREVVERMVATPGHKDFSRLSVMLQYRYDMALLFEVPPEAFDPPPQVHSAIVRMIPKPVESLTATDERVFAEVVAAGFGQRRKMLRTPLAAFLRETEGDAAGIALTDRAEDVPLASWIAFANKVATARAESV